MSVRDIQVFIGFANFYRRFIQSFSKIAISFNFLLKTTRLLKSAPKAFKADDDKVVCGSGDRANGTVVNLSKNEKSRKLMHMLNIGAIEKSNFLTPNAKKVLNHLRLAFIKAPILRHFDLESHIRIKTNVSGYAISDVVS